MAKKEQTEQPTTATPAAAAHDVRRLLGGIRDSERALRDKHAALTRARLHTESALRSREEVLASADELVDALAAKWVEDHGHRLASSISGELREVASGRAELRLQRPALPSLRPDEGLRLVDLAGLAPDLLKARLRVIIGAQPAEVFGLAAADRKGRLAELDRELAAVAEQHEELVRAAREAGLELSHLPSTAARIEAEQAAAERERELIAQREYQRRTEAGEARRGSRASCSPARPCGRAWCRCGPRDDERRASRQGASLLRAVTDAGLPRPDSAPG